MFVAQTKVLRGRGEGAHVWGYVGMAQFWRREAGSESRGRRGSRAPTPPAPGGSPHPRACGHVAPAPASVVTLRPPLPQSSLPLVRTLVRTPGPPRQSGTLSPPQGPSAVDGDSHGFWDQEGDVWGGGTVCPPAGLPGRASCPQHTAQTSPRLFRQTFSMKSRVVNAVGPMGRVWSLQPILFLNNLFFF